MRRVTGGPASALGDQVREALRELVRAFDGADQSAGGAVLGPRSPEGLEAVLAGLVTALLRVLVLACAAGRGLLSSEGATTPAELYAELEEARQRGVKLAERGGAWARLTAAFRAVHGARGGGLFDPERFPFLERGGPSDAALLAVLEGLLVIRGDRILWADIDVEELGATYEAMIGLRLRAAPGDSVVLLPDHVGVDLEALLAIPGDARAAALTARAGGTAGARLATMLARATSTTALRAALARRLSPRWPELAPRGSLFVEPSEERRRAGAHYTPRTLTGPLVARTLEPLLAGTAVLDLRICDPAMGCGAFLLEACRQLGDRLAREGMVGAHERVAGRCLHGVDRDPLAVELARVSLWLVAAAGSRPLSFVDHALRAGDALLGDGAPGGAARATVERLCRELGRTPLHWPLTFHDVFAREGHGFDAFVGNPPWVAYAGRAAQALPAALFDFYLRYYPSFHGYRTLHGLFVYRAASLLRPGGRLGLVVPTSISDLSGYAPARRAHDTLCAVDAELPDFGDAFAGVFQPSMGLLSTRRPAPLDLTASSREVWRVARRDLDRTARNLLDRLSALPPVPAACFGERGLQTSGEDARQLARTGTPAPPFVVPIREGADLRAFHALPPRVHLDPSSLVGKLRTPAAWTAIAVLVRQTARFPIAALADGVAFRNSILAGFPAEGCDHFALLAWLNSAPIRWLHFMRYRDARQGMPQVKIAHLRAVPRVPPEHLPSLRQLGEALGARNQGVTKAEQRSLDDTASRALELSSEDRELIAAWAAEHPAP